MLQVKVHDKHFRWNAYDSQPDISGNTFRLKGNVTLEFGRTCYRHTATVTDANANFISMQMNIVKLYQHQQSSSKFFASEACSLESMQDHRYDKVRRYLVACLCTTRRLGNAAGAKGHAEATAELRLTLDFQSGLVASSDMLDDGQTQPGTTIIA